MTVRDVYALLFLALIAAAPDRHKPPTLYGPPTAPSPYDQCEAAVTSAQSPGIPSTLLLAIARIESGRSDATTGRIRPWPWSINVEGIGTFFVTKEDAIRTVRELQLRGIRSVDVGCMQVNLLFHPAAFASLDDAFDPSKNAAYGAQFLTALYAQTKDWGLAAAYYHSQAQERGEDYQRRLFGRIVTPMGPARTRQMTALTSPEAQFAAIPPADVMFGAFPPPSSQFGAFAYPITPVARRLDLKPARIRR